MNSETETNGPTSLVHYTLNTDHTTVSHRIDVSDEIIRLLAPVVRTGVRLVPRLEEYQLWVVESPGAAVFTLMRRDDELLIHCALAWTETGAQEAWQGLKQIYEYAFDDLHAKPEASIPTRLPWLSAVLFPGCAQLSPEQMYMMDDLERCIAWTILETHT